MYDILRNKYNQTAADVYSFSILLAYVSQQETIVI
jgi:hypothetical protein